MNKHLSFRGIILVMIFLFISVFSLSSAVFAQTLTQIYDQPSSLQEGELSNHTLIFFSPIEIPEGEDFTFVFPAGYDLTGLTEDDIDIEISGGEQTTAENCLGAEAFAVSFSDQNIQFSSCPGNGGAITADEQVRVEIGTHASDSGVGSQKIQNPSTNGTYYINFLSSLDLQASIPVPIISSSTESVSGTIPASSTTSGGGGTTTPSGDSTVTLIWPNGGEQLSPGDAYSVLWSSEGTIPYVDLLYSLDNGGSYVTIVEDLLNTGLYNWTIPQVQSSEVLFQLRGTDLATILASDLSDGTFIIGEVAEPEEEKTVTITWPNGGEQLSPGDTYSLMWETTGEIPLVDISYSINGGDSYQLIQESTENTGIFSWTIPEGIESTEVFVQIQESEGDAVDISDAAVSIMVDILEEEEEVIEEPEEEKEEEETGSEEETQEVDDGTTTVITTPTTPTAPATPGGDSVTEEKVYETTEEVYVGEGKILIEEKQNHLFLLEQMPFIFNVTSEAEEPVKAVEIFLGEQKIEAEEVDGVYRAYIENGEDGAILTATITYENNGTATVSKTIHIKNKGGVFEQDEEEELIPVSGATVFVFRIESGARVQWASADYGQFNPVISREDGAVSWYVPNGSYVVTAAKEGYDDTEEILFVSDNILSPTLILEKTKEEVVIPEEIDETGQVGEDVSQELPQEASTVAAVTEVFSNVQQAIEDFREIPEVQVIADVSKPLAVASAGTGAVVLASSFNLIPWLQYLFSAPVLLIARRKRQQFGVVYHAITKVPVDLAVVRLKNTQGKIVRTMVTDQEGRYFFKIEEGTYTIEIKKNGFVFPSEYLKGEKTDGGFLDVYTGGLVEVTAENALITANIPLDPADDLSAHAPKTLVLKRFLRLFQNILAVSGVILGGYVLFVSPSIQTWTLFGVQVVIYAITYALARPRSHKGWGIVSHAYNKASLANTVVRLFEPKYNKLIETTITDRKGRYAFLAGPNRYYLTFEKPGFEKKEVKPIDFSQKKEPTPISVDVKLNPST